MIMGYKKILFLLLTIIFCAPAQAQYYTVEVILFKNLDVPKTNNEKWPLDISAPDLDQAIDLNQNSATGYQISNALRLKDAAQKLEQSNRYQVLKHFAWRQRGYSKNQAKPIRIHDGHMMKIITTTQDLQRQERLVYPIDGTLTLVLGRYLHLYTNLYYTTPIDQTPNTNTTSISPQQAHLSSIPIHNHRRMRSKELHYIDHPLISMLVLITPS